VRESPSQTLDSTSVFEPWSAVNPGSLGAIGRLLICGGGYTGQRLASTLARLGVPATLTHRGEQPPPGSSLPHWLRFDTDSGIVPEADALADTTHVLITIPPDAQGVDPVLSHLLPALRHRAPAWVGLLSTSGVYGDRGGQWVREDTPPRPVSQRSQARLRCEEAWRSTGLPLQVFRLPAIYGPGRTPFAALLEGRARLIHKPGQVFSRIHVDDIVGALLRCLALPAAERPPILNLADAEPCPSSETLGYAAHLLGRKLPPVERFEEVASSMGPMARSFWLENRRCDSRLLRDSLGYELLYPSYREGYRGSGWPDLAPSREGMRRS
jgi:nucleoside-diphosphate-sugar epimerase